MRWIDWLANTFGGLPFLVAYNVLTVVWVLLGLFDPRFPDPYPSNFYTLCVSWLAINMSSLVLWSERRRKEQEERAEAADRKLLRAMYTLMVKADADRERERQMEKSVLALLESQMAVVSELRKGEGDRKC